MVKFNSIPKLPSFGTSLKRYLTGGGLMIAGFCLYTAGIACIATGFGLGVGLPLCIAGGLVLSAGIGIAMGVAKCEGEAIGRVNAFEQQHGKPAHQQALAKQKDSNRALGDVVRMTLATLKGAHVKFNKKELKKYLEVAIANEVTQSNQHLSDYQNLQQLGYQQLGQQIAANLQQAAPHNKLDKKHVNNLRNVVATAVSAHLANHAPAVASSAPVAQAAPAVAPAPQQQAAAQGHGQHAARALARSSSSSSLSASRS